MRFKGDVTSKMATTMQLLGWRAVTRQFLVRTNSQSLCRRNAQRYVGQVVITFSCYNLISLCSNYHIEIVFLFVRSQVTEVDWGHTDAAHLRAHPHTCRRTDQSR